MKFYDNIDIADLGREFTITSWRALAFPFDLSNIGIGANALASVNAYNNIGIGANALNALTTSDRNTAIGTYALSSLITGPQNTAIGNVAGTALTSGQYNVIVGQQAAYNLLTGDNNIILGCYAAQTMTSGTDNIVISTVSNMPTTSTGIINIGNNSSPTGGNYTVGVGYQVLSGNTGANAVGMGYQSMQNNAGDNTVLLGSAAGQGNTGSFSSGIGFESIRNNTGTGVFAAGYRTAFNNTGDNIFAVGSSAAENNALNNTIFFGRSSTGGGVGYLSMFVGVGPDRTNETIHSFTLRQGNAATGETDKDMGGASLNIAGAVGTGQGPGGPIRLQIAPADVTTGTTQNTLINALTVRGDTGNIDISVNVGIGDAASTSSRLFVKGNDTTSANYALKTTSSSAEILSVRNDHTLIFSGITSGFTGSQKFEKQDGTQTGNKSFPTVRTISTIATANDQMIIIKGTVAGFTAVFSQSYGATFFAVFMNSGGVLTQVSTTDISEKHNFGGSPPVAPSFVVTTDGGTNIIIEVTGILGTLINWVSSYEYTTLSNEI